MISTELLFALAAFAFVSSITPGPNNLMLMASGINFGFARTVPHMLGVSIGFTLMIMLVGAGIIQMLNAVPGAQQIIKIGSIAYLPLVEAGTSHDQAKPFTFIQAALFQWVNPKAWTMALTAVTAYTPKAHPVLGLMTVAFIFGLINLPSVGSWTLMGVKMRRFLNDPIKLRTFNIVAALTLVATLYPVVFTG
jgi:threonine/homoserine/homoserine lactone efflux protein